MINSCPNYSRGLRKRINFRTTKGTSKIQSTVASDHQAVKFRERHLHGSFPEPASNRRTAERKTAATGAPTGRATVALDASSLHSNRAALRKRVPRTRSRNTAPYQQTRQITTLTDIDLSQSGRVGIKRKTAM